MPIIHEQLVRYPVINGKEDWVCAINFDPYLRAI